MKKIIIKELIDQGQSQREIANKLKISQTTVRYYLKKYELKTQKNLYNIIISNDRRICIKCLKNLSINNFYSKSNRINKFHHICKDCSNVISTQKSIENKLKMIKFKGNQCKNCNLHIEDSHYSVFDFHHRDLHSKDINLSSIKKWTWNKIEIELNKCDLLCSNCHRIEHARLRLNI